MKKVTFKKWIILSIIAFIAVIGFGISFAVSTVVNGGEVAISTANNIFVPEASVEAQLNSVEQTIDQAVDQVENSLNMGDLSDQEENNIESQVYQFSNQYLIANKTDLDNYLSDVVPYMFSDTSNLSNDYVDEVSDAIEDAAKDNLDYSSLSNEITNAAYYDDIDEYFEMTYLNNQDMDIYITKYVNDYVKQI